MEEDLPYEREIRKINEERKGNESKKKYQKQMNKAMKIEKEKTVKKENEGHIVDSLSFMSDLSLSNMEDQFFVKKDLINEDFSLEDDNKSEIKNNNELINNTDNSIYSKKEVIFCNEKNIEHIEDNYEEKVNFYKPSSLLASIIKLKNDREVQKKIEKNAR